MKIRMTDGKTHQIRAKVLPWRGIGSLSVMVDESGGVWVEPDNCWDFTPHHALTEAAQDRARLLAAPEIRIVLDEDEIGVSARYTGKITSRAIAARLKKERAKGHRARAVQYRYESSDKNPKGIDLETGSECPWPETDLSR